MLLRTHLNTTRLECMYKSFQLFAAVVVCVCKCYPVLLSQCMEYLIHETVHVSCNHSDDLFLVNVCSDWTFHQLVKWLAFVFSWEHEDFFTHQKSFAPDAVTLDTLIFQQLREIIPRLEVLPLLTYSPCTDTMILLCVVWTLLSAGSYYNAKYPKMSKKVAVGKKHISLTFTQKVKITEVAWKWQALQDWYGFIHHWIVYCVTRNWL
jgi:hypothetical protein